MITVLGDVMVDEYWQLHASGPNPEMDTGRKLTRIGSPLKSLGGAAAVAHVIHASGEATTLASVVGSDVSGAWLIRHCHEQGITTEIARAAGRPTTRKMRMHLDGAPHLDRIDIEEVQDIARQDQTWLTTIPTAELLVLQDYGKGVCTPQVCADVIAQARRNGSLVIVDPAFGRDWQRYQGADVIKCNLSEARKVARSPASHMSALASTLAQRYRCAVVVTAGERGMAYCLPDHAAGICPAVPATVCDVTGAGDTVVATLALALKYGLSLDSACRLAATTAAEQVAQHGVQRVEGLREARTHLCLTPTGLASLA